MPGMSTSEITRSGRSARAAASAWRAPGARLTRWPAISSSEARASRFARLSSTTRMDAMVDRQSSRNGGAAACARANFFVAKSRKLLSCFGYSAVHQGAAPGRNGRLDHARIGGLHEVVIEARFHRAGAVVLLAVAGERDQQPRTVGSLPQAPRHVVAVHAR